MELEGFAAELIDRFGAIPKEVNTLMLIVRIKAMCKRAGISRIDAGPKGATLQFHNDKFANPAGLVEFLREQGVSVTVIPGRSKAEWRRSCTSEIPLCGPVTITSSPTAASYPRRSKWLCRPKDSAPT